MDIAKKILFSLVTILFLFAASFAKAQHVISHFDLPEINCVETKLPLTFSWVNYDELVVDDMPDVVTKKIQTIIIDFYLESNGGDSTDVSRLKETYFNTLRVALNDTKLYIVILKTPLSYAHCKLFLYDSVTNTVSKRVIDYNTWAMYVIDENSMKRSNLYKELHLNNDDIIQAKKTNLLLKRIKPHGTFNELEEITYHPNGTSLDSVSFKTKKLE